MYPDPIENLVKALTKLPTVGKRTAERFVFYLLKSGKKDVAVLTIALKELIEKIKSCEKCWDFSDQSPCIICKDVRRNKSIICVISEPQDLQAVEKIKEYKGLYHVLRGTIKSDNPNSIEWTKTKELLQRIKNENPEEIILALNPNLDGETTMMLLRQKIKEINPTTKITRLARGIPMGGELQYADEITLGSALKNRQTN